MVLQQLRQCRRGRQGRAGSNGMRYTRRLHGAASSIGRSGHFDSYNALTQVFHVPHNAATATAAAPPPPANRQHGPLAGLSYVTKENICTTTGATTCCSRILGAQTDSAYESPFDATCTSLLRSAGASLLGKTNMDEFGMGSFTTNSPYGSTLNPHDAECTAGGSSGGSAAALWLDDLVDQGKGIDFALGTDTGGSVRTPASYCGTYGFKPSYGRISRWGVVPYANSLDTVGILARRRQDSGDGLSVIRRVFAQLDQADENDATCLTNRARVCIASSIAKRNASMADRPLTIGVPREYHLTNLEPAVLRTWRASLEHLAAQGHSLLPISLPSTRAALSAYYILAPAEASSNLAKFSGVFYGARADADRSEQRDGGSGNGRLYAPTRQLFGAEVRRRVLLGCASLSSDRFDNYYLQAQRIRRKIMQEFNGAFALAHPLYTSLAQQTASLGDDDDDHQNGKMSGAKNASKVDYIVTPTATTTAPPLKRVAEMTPAETHAADVYTVPASMAGLPCISVPFGSGENGMPIGIQVIGQYGDDDGVLQVANLLETD